jgi:hypothetical protein
MTLSKDKVRVGKGKHSSALVRWVAIAVVDGGATDELQLMVFIYYGGTSRLVYVMLCGKLHNQLTLLPTIAVIRKALIPGRCHA